MDFWKAEPLKDYKSVFLRSFFRLMWYSVGGILAYLIWVYFLQKSLILYIIAFVIGISTLGGVSDIWRLKRQKKS